MATLKIGFIMLAVMCIFPEVMCLQNEHFSMNAPLIIREFSQKAQFFNDMHSEGYKLLQSMKDIVYSNISVWNEVKTTLTDLNTSNNTKNNSQCIADTLQLLTDTMQVKPYTIQLIDAAGKMPPGVLQGHFVWLGDYQTCMDTSAANNSFYGKYCTASFFSPTLAAIVYNTPISIGLCVPHTCDNETVVDLLQMALRFVPGDILAVSAACSEPKPWTKGDIAALVILSIIALFVAMGTVVDIYCRIVDDEEEDTFVVKTTGSTNADRSVYQDGDNRPHSDTSALVENDILDSGLISPRAFEDRSMEISQEVNTAFARFKGGAFRVFLAMSLITNGEKLLNTTRRNQDLSALNGIRVLSMSWVVLGHTYVFVLMMLDNPAQLLKLPKQFSFQPIINGTFSVDSFFFLSGLLVAYLTLRELQNRDGKLNWLMFYFHRFWRLTPVYMMCLMFYTTLFNHTFFGPIDYGMTQNPQLNSCNTYWWANLLYINNFIPNFREECMAWAWYLANDMQFFVISPIFIILLYRFPKVGFGAVFATIFASVTWTTVVLYQDNSQILLTHQTANTTTAFDGEIYERPYYRISPYLVGILTGYLIYLYKGHLRLPKFAVILGWSVAIPIGMSVIYGLYGDYKNNEEPSRGVAAFYGGVSRFAWSLALSWLAFACVCGYGGPVNKFLSWSVWGPLGRLTYCVYLVHPMVMYWYLLSQQTLFHLTDITIIYLFIANIVASYLVAFVVSLFIEAPMIQLEKVVFDRPDK